MADLKRLENESFLEYAERLIKGRNEGIYDIDKTEIYKLLYGDDVSSDHARKTLRTLELTIEEAKKDNINKKIHEDLNDKDLKYNHNNSIEIHPDGKQTSTKLIEMSEEQSKDVNFLLEKHGFCIKTWELVSARNNIWNVYSKKDGIQVLYSSKIVVKPRVDNITFEEIKEHFEELSKTYKRLVVPRREIIDANEILEIPIMDLHFGKLAWHRETGEDYDYKIAKTRFLGVIQDFIDRVKGRKFEKIIFPIGQDFFNFSTIDGATINGTRQDNDLRWQKLFLVGVELLIQAIDLLSDIAPIDVYYVPGNHDKTTSFYAINYLYAWFKDNANITIDRSPMVRKYVHFGNCLIGYTHSDNEKHRIKGIMQVEAAEAWGKTKFREWHFGHLHSEREQNSIEENGIIFRHISSITGTDAYHIESGYVGAIRKAQAFIWNKEYGLMEILHSVIV